MTKKYKEGDRVYVAAKYYTLAEKRKVCMATIIYISKPEYKGEPILYTIAREPSRKEIAFKRFNDVSQCRRQELFDSKKECQRKNLLEAIKIYEANIEVKEDEIKKLKNKLNKIRKDIVN